MTVVSFDGMFFNGWREYNPECNGSCDNKPEIWRGTIDFWVSACYTPVITVHNWDDYNHELEPVITDYFPSQPIGRVTKGWTKIGYSLNSATTRSNGSGILIR